MFKHIHTCSTNTCFFFTMIRGVRIRILFPFFHFPKHRVLQTIVFFTKGNKALFSLLPFPETSSRSEEARLFFARKGEKILPPFYPFGKHLADNLICMCCFTVIRGHKDLLSHLAFPATSNRQTCSNMFKQYVLLLHNDQGKSGSYFRPFISRNIEHIKQ